ncbi:D-amino acid dehydrogenase 1 [Methylobacterium frigidaeris]|uniref:D-amino acid dehydrogenase 1 n=2 Tax=Methylobacterium frigidaeris TaxID=2038277 RepID=A0AA37H720_9HYPH|nr:D-amino acid dehydrogenase 1 [Methylobacterium frigidaeris]
MERVSGQKTSFDLIVLGAGVVGTATAYWAAKAGLSVCVIDRQGGAGLETSYANGGQISVSHAEPWANPSAPLKVMKWLFDARAPLLFTPRLDRHQWSWIAGFLRNCTPERARRNTVEIVRLGAYSRAKLQEIRAAENLTYAEKTLGILHFYRDTKEFEAAKPVAELMRQHGCERRVVSRDEVLAIEPAFASSIDDIVGATYTAEDESGDARAFTQALAARTAAMGATFLYGSEATRLLLSPSGDRITGVEAMVAGGHQRLTAPNVVVSLGSWSAPFLRRYGVNLAIYPAKGYSVSIPIEGHNGAPQVSLTDDEYKLVYSNLGTHLRVAGTAELSGYTRHLDAARVAAILENARRTFPNAGNFSAATAWSGLRPTTPSNVPYLGRTQIRGLVLNTGHGTLGWTMAAGSGRIAADLVTERETEIPAPLAA